MATCTTSAQGPLDFRGKREAPKISQQTIKEVEHAREHNEEVEGSGEGELVELPQKTEEELASPPMQVFQRLFTTEVGKEETNIERPHENVPSSAEMVYVNADGHHHWPRQAEFGSALISANVGWALV